MITAQQALQRVIEHHEIFHDEMLHLMRLIMQGEVSPILTAALLTGLRVKKETIGEITAAATVMRELCTPVEVSEQQNFVDIVGTGGDAAHSLNISTAAAIVCAACGARVAKHGNRSVSSKSGAADVLEELGAKIDLQANQVARCINEVNMGFMFAPNHHPAMKNVAPVRREMAVRTIFNILGPLTNPANTPNTLLGVFHPDLVGILVRVMQRLGAQRVLVVWGKDGMDEISLGAATMVAELKEDRISEYEIHPEDFNLNMSSGRNLRVDSPQHSKQMLLAALSNQPGPGLDIICLNAGAALYVANLAEDIAQGLNLARQAIASGAAQKKLNEFIKFTSTV